MKKGFDLGTIAFSAILSVGIGTGIIALTRSCERNNLERRDESNERAIPNFKGDRFKFGFSEWIMNKPEEPRPQLIYQRTYREDYVYGRVYLDDKKRDRRAGQFNDDFKIYVCGFLEPHWANNKSFESCIPEGVYNVLPIESMNGTKYGSFVLEKIPNREKVYIVAGKKPLFADLIVGLREVSAGVAKDSKSVLEGLVNEFPNGFDLTIKGNE